MCGLTAVSVLTVAGLLTRMATISFRCCTSSGELTGRDVISCASLVVSCNDICYLCKKNCSVYIQCKGDIVVVDIKQHKSQFNNSNITITQCQKNFSDCVMVKFEF